VLRLLDGNFSEKIAVAGKKQAMERYHPRGIALRHLEIYREVSQGGLVAAKAA
jgi:hypothetical protein